MNENGELFAVFCLSNDLVIAGTIFPHRRKHKATWVSPDGVTENQVDQVCISRKFRRSLQDVRVKRGAETASDHHLLVGKVQMKLRKFTQTTKNPRTRYQVNLLKDQNVNQAFRSCRTCKRIQKTA